MKAHDQHERLILEQCSEWMERLKHATDAEREEFGEWLLQSPLHVRHFLMMTALDEELRRFDPERTLKVERAPRIEGIRHSQKAAELDGSEPLSDLRGALAPTAAQLQARKGRFAGIPLRWHALAAVGVLIVGTWFLIAPKPDTEAVPWQEYSATTGQVQVLPLPDGSKVHLNTGSRLAVSFSEQARDVRLLSGEALFDIAGNPARPFLIHTSKAIVRAVGTQINVSRSPADARVTVVEGLATIYSDPNPDRRARNPGPIPKGATAVAMGEQSTVDANGEAGKVRKVDLAEVIAWKQRPLSFKGQSLEEVAREFNRYNKTQIVIVDPELKARAFDGYFPGNDAKLLLDELRDNDTLDVREQGIEVQVRARKHGTGSAAK
jgi:transmembrane sensor